MYLSLPCASVILIAHSCMYKALYILMGWHAVYFVSLHIIRLCHPVYCLGCVYGLCNSFTTMAVPFYYYFSKFNCSKTSCTNCSNCSKRFQRSCCWSNCSKMVRPLLSWELQSVYGPMYASQTLFPDMIRPCMLRPSSAFSISSVSCAGQHDQ